MGKRVRPDAARCARPEATPNVARRHEEEGLRRKGEIRLYDTGATVEGLVVRARSYEDAVRGYAEAISALNRWRATVGETDLGEPRTPHFAAAFVERVADRPAPDTLVIDATAGPVRPAH